MTLGTIIKPIYLLVWLFSNLDFISNL